MWLAVEQHAGGTFGTTGSTTLYTPESIASPFTLTMDTDLNVIKARGTAFNYKGRCYIVGQYSDNTLIDEHFRLMRQGIVPPDTIPVLAAGGGSGPAGTHLGYVSFYDSKTDEDSPLSGASVGFSNAGATQITWTNLPTTSVDARVDKIRLWRSVDGGAIRFVTERDLGVSTVTEAVATLALGQVAADTFERFPRCRVNTAYHDRQFMAGDEANQDTLYYSALFKLERWEGGSFTTRNGEPIVALVPVQDMLLVLCPNSSYILQGYTEADFTFSLSEPELGATSQHLIQLVHGNAWIPNSKSIFLFNGSWHNVLKQGQEEWRQFHAAQCENATTGGFDLAFSVFDPVRNVYKLGMYLDNATIPGADIYGPPASGTYYWVADVVPATLELAGSYDQPNWSFDLRARQDSSVAVLTTPGGACQGVYTGSCDGHIRKENVDGDDDDAGDTWSKRLVIRLGANYMADPGGTTEEAKHLLRLWVYAERGTTEAFEVLAMGGDEDAWRLQELLRTGGQGGDGINVRFFYKATGLTTTDTEDVGTLELTYTALGCYHLVPERVSGRAFTFLITAAAPVRLKWRGIGGTYEPGKASRPPYSEVASG
jgi:hypothetical protein